MCMFVCIAIAAGQQAGTLQAENHPPLSWSDHGENKACKVVIDANWRWTHKIGETTNCYTDNFWDPTLSAPTRTPALRTAWLREPTRNTPTHTVSTQMEAH